MEKIKKKEIVIGKIYRCVCGSLFKKRDDLITHIKNKKKGIYKNNHYMGNYTNGGGILFLSTFKKVEK